MAYNIGPKIGIDGEREFRNSIKKINDTYKALEAETRAATAAFEANGDEQGKLEVTAKNLQKQIDLQKEKMEKLQDAVKKASDKYGENSLEATRLRGAMFDAQASAAKLEAELQDVTSQLDGSEEAMEEFADAAEDAGDKALTFGDILKADVISDVIMDGLREMADLVKEFGSGAIEEAASMQAVEAQVEQTFGTMKDLAEDALQDISEDTNIAGTRMQTAFTKIYAFAKTSGATAENALTISSRAMIVAADSAAYYDRSIEEATETLQAFLKGNYANDAALGIACTEVTRNTKANELYAKSFKELSESQKVDTLLAMVEAGNEASGAIGQAARESDSWENVTGELAEVMRLLQVEVGKPALKKLIPSIQKITKEGHELIEDIDWDEFAEKVEDLMDGAIEHGPKIVRMIATIGAAIVAIKAVKKAQELTSVASAFFGIGNAAKAASQTVAATGAAAMASPWGAVAAVIGAGVALITSYAIRAKSDSEQLSDAMDKLQERLEDANADFEETKREVEENAIAAQYYVDRLEELEKAGLNTAASQREYEMVVEQLNELLPELNLTINEQTGLVDQNTDAIRANIESLKNQAIQQAMQERFTDVLKAEAAAKIEIAEAQVKLNQKKEKKVALEKAEEAAIEEVEKAQKKANAAAKAYQDAIKLKNADDHTISAELQKMQKASEEANAELEKQKAALAGVKGQINANEKSMEAYSKEISKGEDTLAEYAEEIALAKEMCDLFAESTSGVSKEQADLNLKIEDLQNALDSVQTAYADALAEAQTSIGGQIDLFGDLAEESNYSAKQIAKDWEKKYKAMMDYADNLKKVADMGLDQALIEQLSDGSEESMLIIDQWADETEKGIQKINNAFGNLEEAKTHVAETVTEIKYGFEEQMQEIEETAQKSGLQIINGVVKGIEDETGKLENTMAAAAKKAINAFDRKMMIRSPAKAMVPSGKYTVGGIVEGVDENVRLLEKSMEELAIAGQGAFDQKQLDRAADYPMQVPATSAVQNTSVAHNYGGIAIQIYPQEGQDAKEIADAVMERLQAEVDRRETAL